MIWLMYLRFIVPVLAVFYGTSLIADEVEDKTITYLFTRPIPRGAVMAGKYLAYLVCTIMVVLPSVMIVYFLIVPYGGGSIAASFPDLVKDLALLALGLIAYGALFAWVGARFKRPLLTGLIFVFGWEQAAMVFPGYLKRFTIAYYLQALVPHTMPSDNLLGMLQAIVQRDAVAAVLPGVGWPSSRRLFMWLAIRLVGKREYVLEQIAVAAVPSNGQKCPPAELFQRPVSIIRYRPALRDYPMNKKTRIFLVASALTLSVGLCTGLLAYYGGLRRWPPRARPAPTS